MASTNPYPVYCVNCRRSLRAADIYCPYCKQDQRPGAPDINEVKRHQQAAAQQAAAQQAAQATIQAQLPAGSHNKTYQTQIPALPNRHPKMSTKIAKIVAWCVLAWILIIFLAQLPFSGSSPSNSDSSPSSSEPQIASKSEVWVMACEFAKKKLVAPSTAVFPNSFDDGVKIELLAENIWSVQGYVDSQNSFGAMLRSNFTCLLEEDKTDDSWRGTVEIN